ncbi:MAG: hypothetical protein HC888_10020, partial [Candidatus Competibacteraceae bacterium]|nr:hypothetical protein [Candidatus Competibacteraceae bacterium]
MQTPDPSNSRKTTEIKRSESLESLVASHHEGDIHTEGHADSRVDNNGDPGERQSQLEVGYVPVNESVETIDQLGQALASAVNAGTGAFSPANLYTAQVDGNTAEIVDSVFYNIVPGFAAGDVVTSDVTNAANDNVQATLLPIQAITRGTLFTSTGEAKDVAPVISLDPRACQRRDRQRARRRADDDGAGRLDFHHCQPALIGAVGAEAEHTVDAGK